MKELEEILKKELDCEVVEPFGHGSGEFRSYDTDKYGKVFVKLSSDTDIARPMFEAEMASLNFLRELNLPNVTIAKPYKIIDLPYMRGGACLVLDYLFTESLYNNDLQSKIGTAVAHMHLHNIRMKKENPDKYVDKFGFNMSTYCGRIAQNNEWKKDWLDFIMNNRLGHQIDLLRTKLGHEEAAHLWDFKIKPNLHKLFENVSVEPSILHGDLWAGNVGMKVDESEAYMYDPAVFYGHHEYDLAISSMFPGFRQQFYDAYHALIPKAPGFEDRQRVYQLFHYLNHWNQYGRAYYYYTVNMMRDICLSLNLRGVNYRKIEDDYDDFNRIKADNRAVYRKTKPLNRSALFNTTRKRGRFANISKTTPTPPLSTRLKTKWVKMTKARQNTEIDSSEEQEEPYNGTTLSLNQIYHIFYKYEGFDWLR